MIVQACNPWDDHALLIMDSNRIESVGSNFDVTKFSKDRGCSVWYRGSRIQVSERCIACPLEECVEDGDKGQQALSVFMNERLKSELPDVGRVQTGLSSNTGATGSGTSDLLHDEVTRTDLKVHDIAIRLGVTERTVYRMRKKYKTVAG